MRRSPPRRTPPSALLSTSDTTDSGTKREKASRTISRSNAAVTAWTAVDSTAARPSASIGYATGTIVPRLNSIWLPTA